VGQSKWQYPPARTEWYASLAGADLAAQLRLLFMGYEGLREQVREA
jgi:hypothetical protein